MNESCSLRAARMFSRVAILFTLLFALPGCAAIAERDTQRTERLQEISQLVKDVKAFGKTVGIEPTEALTRTSSQSAPLSMLWLWMQRVGTLALRGPIDIHMAIGFATEQERLKVEQVYRVDGYSVYYRQGSEFADPRSVATVGFSDEPLVRRVKVILHEDLHGDANFALPWQIEEGLVTPLGSLAAVEYFRVKHDEKNLAGALATLREERQVSRDLNDIAAQAVKIFANEKVDAGKEKVLGLLANYPTYYRQFERQVEGQHKATVLEAKLSHDLIYYRFFDAVANLAEKAPLQILIADLRRSPSDGDPEKTARYLGDLSAKYASLAP